MHITEGEGASMINNVEFLYMRILLPKERVLEDLIKDFVCVCARVCLCVGL